MGVDLRHGGNRQAVADVLGCRPSQLLDASASLAPWTPRCPRLAEAALRDYPDRDQASLRQAIAVIHGVSPDWVLPGNGAAELFMHGEKCIDYMPIPLAKFNEDLGKPIL